MSAADRAGEAEEHREAVGARWYTRARHVPQLIGITADGARLPGGPYTLLQFTGGVAVGYLAYRLMPLWAHFGFGANAALYLGIIVGTVLLLGRVPADSRNPLSLLSGFGRAASAPRWGLVDGRLVRPKPPVTLVHRFAVLPDPEAGRAPAAVVEGNADRRRRTVADGPPAAGTRRQAATRGTTPHPTRGRRVPAAAPGTPTPQTAPWLRTGVERALDSRTGNAARLPRRVR